MKLSEIFHLLCSEYGWTISYVANLKVKQITTMLGANVSCKKRLNENVKSSGKPEKGVKIKNVKDMIQYGLLRKRKK